ncbi:hypothetical protein [Enterovirga sp. CN4-39]|uniref:hypothetical protein n=1 Tax=Enterovirga sp. CN4-39 TaxID=3400910 RepID=UPI003C07532A
MYLARFSYGIRPADRERALELIRREVAAAQSEGLNARLLIPLTRAQGGPALQFEVELTSLDQLDGLRQRTPKEGEGDWMRDFSQILLTPPAVEVLRVG